MVLRKFPGKVVDQGKVVQGMAVLQAEVAHILGVPALDMVRLVDKPDYGVLLLGHSLEVVLLRGEVLLGMVAVQDILKI